MGHGLGQGDLALGTAQDEVALADRGVAVAAEEVAASEAELLALDAPITRVWTTLLGSRERELEEAVARVARSRQRLAAATAHREQARARLEDVRRAGDARRAHEAEAAAARQEHLDRAAEAPGPAGQRARALRTERALLAERSSALDAAAWAGTDLLAVISTVANEGDGIARRTVRDQLGIAAAIRPGEAAARFVQSELAGAAARGRVVSAVGQFAERAEAFRVALAALGRVYAVEAVSEVAVSPELGLLVNGLLGELALAASAQELAQAMIGREGRIQDLLIPVDRERRQLQEAISTLDAEEAALAGLPPA